jgi:hypothetical protein
MPLFCRLAVQGNRVEPALRESEFSPTGKEILFEFYQRYTI